MPLHPILFIPRTFSSPLTLRTGASLTLEDNVEWLIGTAGGESILKSDGTSTIWNIASGKRLDVTFAGSGGFQYAAAAFAFQEATTISVPVNTNLTLQTTGTGLTNIALVNTVLTVAAASPAGYVGVTNNTGNAAATTQANILRLRIASTSGTHSNSAIGVERNGTAGAADFVIAPSQATSGDPAERWRATSGGILTSGGAVPSNAANVDGGILAEGGIAFTDVANAWIDDATHGDGTVVHYIGNNTINTTAPSDVRLKDNISPLDSLTVLRRLPVIEFTSTHWGPGRWGGFDAQAAGQVLPNLAMQDTQGYWRFQGHLLMPYVVGGIQEVMKRVDALEQENQELRALVAGSTRP